MILHSKITPERTQINPQVTKVMHLGHIFFSGLHQKKTLCPTPLPNRGKPPILQMALQSPFFVSEVKKKPYQRSKLGKKKDYQNMVRTHMGNLTKHFVNAFYPFE